MIAGLRGRVVAQGEDHIILEVGGIGFLVHVPRTLLGQPSSLEGELRLHTHLHVRENELSLYGFASREELAFFQLLLGVSGIGPKVGLGILSWASPAELQRAILQGDIEALMEIPGIGRRSAERLVLDLREKIEGEAPIPMVSLSPGDAEVLEVLLALGYTRQEAESALQSISESDAPLEERIRQALQYMGVHG
jgi:Holliday junction DNA helicase RuvA